MRVLKELCKGIEKPGKEKVHRSKEIEEIRVKEFIVKKPLDLFAIDE